MQNFVNRPLRFHKGYHPGGDNLLPQHSENILSPTKCLIDPTNVLKKPAPLCLQSANRGQNTAFSQSFLDYEHKLLFSEIMGPLNQADKTIECAVVRGQEGQAGP